MGAGYTRFSKLDSPGHQRQISSLGLTTRMSTRLQEDVVNGRWFGRVSSLRVKDEFKRLRLAKVTSSWTPKWAQLPSVPRQEPKEYHRYLSPQGSQPICATVHCFSRGHTGLLAYVWWHASRSVGCWPPTDCGIPKDTMNVINLILLRNHIYIYIHTEGVTRSYFS